ncbi:serine/threonine-protein kinase [Sandaracinus amylolyticus]|uniref:serine/threonine-protein kinase n=1 Tax=Sandaracinus amylolyticus TaxID=927083 RepID=UPI001F032878|nr:serine/threonine-protein kinase [Sandaracinus amylolyticus]
MTQGVASDDTRSTDPMAIPPPSAPDSSGTPCPHCGEPHPTSYTHCPKTGKALTVGRALIGRLIAGKYRVIGLLGEGGMGAVYVAEHTLIGRKVAIKRLHPELAQDEKAVQRFQREARAAAATGHEHIVEILDLGFAEDNAPYLVMEYLRGQSLAALLRKEHRLEPKRACDVVGQALAGLDAVHRQHIVHRDLKPDNVFLTRRANNADWVKILDFGISKVRREEGDGLDLTRTGVMMGTPFYMSPEQARGMKNLDHRVDLYAVGVILYECITGRVPFEGENYHQLLQSILRSEPPRPSLMRPDLDPALEAVVLRAIAKDPKSRFESAEAMLAALIPFGAEPPTPHGLESMEGSALPIPTMMQATTPVSPGGHADRIAVMRDAPPAPIEPVLRSPPSRPSLEPARPSLDPGRPSRGAAASALSQPTIATSTPTIAATPVPAGGARYFFAASDDWDEARARAAIESAHRPTPPREMPVAVREPSAPFPREPVSGVVSAAGVREPSGATPIGRDSLSYREATGPAREGPRLLAPIDPEPPASRESSFASATPLPVDPWSVLTPSRSGSGSADVEIKGSLVIATLDHLEAAYGAAAVAQIREHLDRESLARVSSVILPMAWLPMALFDQLVRGAERVVGASDWATSTGIGRAIADRELPTTHRLFMQTASPSAATERIPQLFRLYHSRGDAKVLPTPGGGVRVEVDLAAPESLSYAWALAGFWQRMLELTGAREVRAAVVSCRGRGDDRTAVALRWR